MRALPIERLAFVLALVSSSSSLQRDAFCAPSSGLADSVVLGAACGDKPLPPCPLDAWMKANMARAILASDFDALAVAFEKAVTFAPAGYPNWSSIAKDGADAARAQSLDGTKGACRGCHAQYRERYRKEMRDRPL